MDSLVDTLRDLAAQVGDVVSAALAAGTVRGLSDADVLALLDTAGEIGRRADAVLVEATAQVAVRSETVATADRFTTRHGCRTVAELVQRTARVSGQTARSVARAADAVAEPIALTTGAPMPADFPALRQALVDGIVGVDGVVAVSGAISAATRDTAHRLAADTEIAAAARGR